MATNFYLHRNPCPHCGKADEADDILHIGQHVFCWTFALHVIPEKGLNSLDDWEKLIRKEDSKVMDDDGDERNSTLLLSLIRKGHSQTPWELRAEGLPREEEFHRMNGSMRGPNGLLRRRIDGSHCIGHGDGPWDLIAGEFS